MLDGHSQQRRGLAVKINVGHGPGGGLPPTNSNTSTNNTTNINTGTSDIYPERNSGQATPTTTATTFGHGGGMYTNNSTNKSSGAAKFRASPEQRTVARLELERMRRSTDRLLVLLSHNTSTPSAEDAIANDTDKEAEVVRSPAFSNELRVALHYWTTRWYSHHHPYLTATPTVGTKDDAGAVTAERLLDAIVAFDLRVGGEGNEGDGRGGGAAQESSLLVDRVIGADGNAALVNLIEARLLPCTTTGAGPMGSASSGGGGVGIGTASPASSGALATTSKSIDDRAWIGAIRKALRVYGTMTSLWEEERCDARPDTASLAAGLNVLSKLCGVLQSKNRGTMNESTQKELVEAINATLRPPQPLETSHLSADDVLGVMEDMIVDAERRYHDPSSRDNNGADSGPSCGGGVIQPDVLTYNTYLGAYARCHPNERGLAQVGRYIRAMEALEDGEEEDRPTTDDDTSNDPDEGACSNDRRPFAPTAPPDSVTYNSLLHICSALAAASTYGERGAAAASSHAARAAAVLRRMEDRSRRTGRPEVLPDTISYATVLHSYANVGNAREAERILDHMERVGGQDQDQDLDDRVNANIICYNSTLHGWSKSKEDDAPHRAEDLLRRMERLGRDFPDRGIRPDIISYSAVMAAWSRSGASNSAERAQQLLEQCSELARTDDRLQPDVVTYNSVLGAWANRCSRERGKPAAVEAAREAERIIQRMEASDDVQPCTISYNILLDAWSKAGGEGCEAKAEQILRSMTSPDEISWNTVIAGYANNGSKEALVKSLHLLKEMEASATPPSAISYNLVMDVLARKGTVESALKVEKLLEKMEMMYESGSKDLMKPNALSYNIALNAWAKSGSPDSGEKAQHILKRMATNARKWNASELSPDVVSYASTIDSLANGGKKGAAREAEQLLESMFQEGDVAPNRITYNTVMNAIAKSNERGSAKRAEAILNQMDTLYEEGNNDGVRPDSVSYSTVLNAWARSGEPDAADRADALLRRLEARAKDLSGDPVRPNAHCYSSVLTAISRSDDPAAPDRALALLDRMSEMYLSGNRCAQPNAFCYNAAINAFAKSSRADKAVQSELILNRMLDDYRSGRNRQTKPSALTYSTILNACAYTRGSARDRAEAFRIARACFRDVLSLKETNGVEFAMFLLACARLSTPGAERDALVRSVFEECCRRGLVNQLVLRNVRNAASPRLQRELLGRPARDIAYGDLPEEWTSNVQSRRRGGV